MHGARPAYLPSNNILSRQDGQDGAQEMLRSVSLGILVSSVLFLKNLGPSMSGVSLVLGSAMFGLFQSLFTSHYYTCSFVLVGKKMTCLSGGILGYKAPQASSEAL